MRWKARAEKVLVWLAVIAACGCMPKVNDALKNAESAIAEAEAASASQKYPELLDAANAHLKEGKRQRYLFRSNLAQVQFQAAEEAAKIAAQYARTGPGAAPGGPVKCPACIERTCPSCPPAPAPSCPEVKPCPPCPEGTSCPPCPERPCPERPCPEKACAPCPSPAPKTAGETSPRHCPSCHCPACDHEAPHCPACPREPAATKPEKQPVTAGGLVIGTIAYSVPALEAGKSNYQLGVAYAASSLDSGAAKAGDNYRLLIDVVKAEPAGVTVSSTMNDYEPLTAHNGEWKLPLEVPAELKGPVTVTLQISLMNSATKKEQKLAPAVLTIPAPAECHKTDAKVTPLAPAPPPAAPPAAKSDWLGRLIMVIIGLAVGAGGGYGAARVLSAKGPTIKAGE